MNSESALTLCFLSILLTDANTTTFGKAIGVTTAAIWAVLALIRFLKEQ